MNFHNTSHNSNQECGDRLFPFEMFSKSLMTVIAADIFNSQEIRLHIIGRRFASRRRKPYVFNNDSHIQKCNSLPFSSTTMYCAIVCPPVRDRLSLLDVTCFIQFLFLFFSSSLTRCHFYAKLPQFSLGRLFRFFLESNDGYNDSCKTNSRFRLKLISE